MRLHILCESPPRHETRSLVLKTAVKISCNFAWLFKGNRIFFHILTVHITKDAHFVLLNRVADVKVLIIFSQDESKIVNYRESKYPISFQSSTAKKQTAKFSSAKLKKKYYPAILYS